MTDFAILTLAAWAVSQLLDVWSTNGGIARGAYEANPVVLWMMDRFGELWWVPKLALAAGVAWLFWWGNVLPWLWLATVGYGVIIINNLRVSR